MVPTWGSVNRKKVMAAMRSPGVYSANDVSADELPYRHFGGRCHVDRSGAFRGQPRPSVTVVVRQIAPMITVKR